MAQVDDGVVLVIEDDPSVALLLRTLLDDEGHRVVQVGSAEEGIAAMAVQIPLAVLLDLRLPDRDGTGVIAAMRADERLQDVPVLVVSGRTDLGLVLRCLELGATDYIVKPFEPEDLTARLAELLAARAAAPR